MKHLQILLLLMLFLVSCASKQTEPASKNLDDYLQHRVKYAGESLGIISGWYTGKSLNWTLIEAENPGLDVKKIKIGDTILIPKSLLKRSLALPQSYIEGINQAEAKKKDAELAAEGLPVEEQPATEEEVPVSPESVATPLATPEILDELAEVTEEAFDEPLPEPTPAKIQTSPRDELKY